jgi:peroxiredoxin
MTLPAKANYRRIDSVEEEAGMKSLEGQTAPAFSLPGNDGKEHSLQDYRGKKVVLFFYPKDSTPG